MVDIEVGRARMYFSVENMAKMGTEGLDMQNTVSGTQTTSF